MKIAMVCASDAHGGLEKHVADLAAGMVERGHEVTVIAPAGFGSQLPPSVTFKPVALKRSRWSPWLRRDLIRALSGEWDILHAHANKAAQLVGSLRHVISARRWIATLHNLKSDNRMFSRFDHVIAVSQALVTTVPNPKVTVVLNGIDPIGIEGPKDRSWLAAISGLGVDRPILLAIGRLVSAKGFDLLMRAAVAANAQVVIAGEGPERGMLERLQTALKASNVVLLGHRTDVPQLLSACDGFVISSRNEGGPYTLSEALLANRPVLATRVGMVPDVMPEALIMGNSPAEMAEYLATWSAQLPEWQSRCAQAFEVAKRRLTRSGMLEATEAVYRDTSV